MTQSRRLGELTDQLIADSRPRAKSLIATVFGDAIAPHGGTVWLGSLIRLLAPFGLNERLVRTAVLRLSRDDWLTARQIGRRSFYGLTESGRRRFDDAHRRIYSVPRQVWDGRWTLVILGLGEASPGTRERLRRELTWLGFGQLAASCMIHPTPDEAALSHVLQDLHAGEGVAVMSATTLGRDQQTALRELVRQCWRLDQLSEGYRNFLARFRPILQAVQAATAPAPETCFLIRTLLIHEYRRVLLRDPQLPDELLPAEWAGTAARVLCRNLYRLTQAEAERHVMATLETAEGSLPEAAPYFYERFGGLGAERERERHSA